MADVWSGDILLSDEHIIKDVILASQNPASCPPLPAPTLRFLSTVDTTRIPLYLAAGPSLDVYTTSEATQEWFESVLLSTPVIDGATSEYASAGRGWWSCARSQSPVGILVQLENELAGEQKAPRVTEILFYGTITASTNASIPSPPFSSPETQLHLSEVLPELRVHALPLSTDFLHGPNAPERPPLSPTLSTADAPETRDAQFLPSALSTTTAQPPSPKRKFDQFEEAIIRQKKARRKGGEAIAAAAAASKGFDTHRALPHRRSMSIDIKSPTLSDMRPASAGNPLARPPSRALSRTSRSPSVSSDPIPNRKSAAEGQIKRSALSQVATVPIQPEEPTTETRNKEALSRVVLAAMRMHGFQQRKKDRSRRASMVPGAAAGVKAAEELSEEAAREEEKRDEEYKMIYHQTYKGAALALRKHISTIPLHANPNVLEDVVEQLLNIFCTDPLAEPPPPLTSEHPVATPAQERLGFAFPGSTHGRLRESPFDLPSGNRSAGRALLKAQVAQGQGSKLAEANTGSPVSRRKKSMLERGLEGGRVMGGVEEGGVRGLEIGKSGGGEEE